MNANESAHHNRESGQVLAFVAVLMVVLLAMLALVLDGGNLYLHRRRMQNAADAGAIAGARILCCDGTAAEAFAAAQDYSVVRNQADMADITVDGWTVTVVAHKDVPMTFARIIGLDQIAVIAEAAAMCGPAGGVMGMNPIAILDFEYEFEESYTIWDREVDAITDADGNSIPGSGRGWLSLDCTYPDECTEGADPLKDYVIDGYSGEIEVGDDVRPASGEMAAVIQQVEVDQELLMPVYDIYPDYPDGATKPYYRIIKFAVFHVTEVDSTGNDKHITGYFVTWVTPGDINPDGPDGGLRTVALIR